MANITITSVITGIHVTKRSSHRDVKLLVVEDPDAEDIDENVLMVKVPPIEDIPPELHSAVAYPKSRNPTYPRQTDLLMHKVAGKKVGNVPANLCGLFRQLKAGKKVKEIQW